MLRCSGVLIAGLVFVLGCGCGGSFAPTTTVEGTVAIDGTPVADGTISFTPLELEAGSVVTAEIRNGEYRARRVHTGRTMVQFQVMEETGKMLTDESEGGAPYPERIDRVPDKYRGGVEITVTDDGESHNFELTS